MPVERWASCCGAISALPGCRDGLPAWFSSAWDCGWHGREGSRTNEKEHAQTARVPSFLTSILKLHQKFICLPRDGVLHLFQFVLHLVQAVHEPLEFLGHAAEERRHLGVLKVFEL